MSGGDGNDEVRREFDASVNMTRRELERWLDSDASKSVGVAAGTKKTGSGGVGGPSVTSRSGRRRSRSRTRAGAAR